MADIKDVIYTILKWAIVIITAIILILLTIDVIKNAKGMEAEQVIYVILTYLFLFFGFFGAYKEEFLYLVIFGVVLILDLIYAFSARTTTTVENKGILVILTIITWVFAFMIRLGGARAISVA